MQLHSGEQTIEIRLIVLKWIIALLVGGNTGFLGLILRFFWKHYRKYKNAFMMYVEEHEKLVEDYLRRHPEEIPKKYPKYFSRIGKPKPKPRLFSTESDADGDDGISE